MDRQNTEKGQIEKKDKQIQNRQIGAKKQTDRRTDRQARSISKELDDMTWNEKCPIDLTDQTKTDKGEGQRTHPKQKNQIFQFFKKGPVLIPL